MSDILLGLAIVGGTVLATLSIPAITDGWTQRRGRFFVAGLLIIGVAIGLLGR